MVVFFNVVCSCLGWSWQSGRRASSASLVGDVRHKGFGLMLSDERVNPIKGFLSILEDIQTMGERQSLRQLDSDSQVTATYYMAFIHVIYIIK